MVQLSKESSESNRTENYARLIESNESSLVWVPETLRETEGFYESLRQPSPLSQPREPTQ